MIADLISVIFPATCPSCKNLLMQQEQLVCSNCAQKLRINHDYSEENILNKSWIGRVEIKHSIFFSYFDKGNPMQSLLHQIKYKGRPDIARKLGELTGQTMMKYYSTDEFDIMIPVPLHWRKQRKRGYNQSVQIAKGIQKHFEIPVRLEIKRVNYGKTQTFKNRYERLESLTNSFSLKNPDNIHGKNILLIDDVITTGSTLEHIAEILLENNANSVSILAIAYTEK